MIEGTGNLGSFGRGMKMAKIKTLLEGIGQGAGADADESDLASFLGGAREGKPSMPFYDPQRLYGGLFKAYGGRRVMGGLLGE